MVAKETGEKSNDPFQGQTHIDRDIAESPILDVDVWVEQGEVVAYSPLENITGRIQAVKLAPETRRELEVALLRREGLMRILVTSLLITFLVTALFYMTLVVTMMFLPQANLEPLSRFERLLVIEASLLGSAYWWKRHKDNPQGND